GRAASYRIEVDVRSAGMAPRMVSERLSIEGSGPLFDSELAHQNRPDTDAAHLSVTLWPGKRGRPRVGAFLSQQPVLTQLLDYPGATTALKDLVRESVHAFSGMQFLDPSPDTIRSPSVPGQTILG